MWQGQAVGKPHTQGREAHPWANQMDPNPRPTGQSQTPGTASLIPKGPSQVIPSWPEQPGTEALSCPGLRSQFPKVHLLGLGTQEWAHSLQQPEDLCQVLGSRLGAHCPGGLGGPEGIPHPGSGG